MLRPLQPSFDIVNECTPRTIRPLHGQLQPLCLTWLMKGNKYSVASSSSLRFQVLLVHASCAIDPVFTSILKKQICDYRFHTIRLNSFRNVSEHIQIVLSHSAQLSHAARARVVLLYRVEDGGTVVPKRGIRARPACTITAPVPSTVLHEHEVRIGIRG